MGESTSSRTWGPKVPKLTEGLNRPQPAQGEIDIVEGVHRTTQNAMSVHTGPGCSMGTSGYSAKLMMTSGRKTDCNVYASDGQGCGVRSVDKKSYGPGANKVGGGVYALECERLDSLCCSLSAPLTQGRTSRARNNRVLLRHQDVPLVALQSARRHQEGQTLPLGEVGQTSLVRPPIDVPPVQPLQESTTRPRDQLVRNLCVSFPLLHSQPFFPISLLP